MNGGKSGNLKILEKNGFNVPPLATVPTKIFENFLDPIRIEVLEIIKSEPSKVAEEKTLSLFVNQDKERMIELNNWIEGEIPSIFQGVKWFVARSSGKVASTNGSQIEEDSETHSLAGQFDSYLKISLEKLALGILSVWASLFNQRSLQVFQAAESNHFVNSCSMEVVIQEFLEADVSVVAMSECSMEPGVGAIEASYGACEAIVSGLVTPDLIRFDRTNGKILSYDIGGKEDIVDFKKFESPFSENRILKRTNEKMRAKPAMHNDQIIQMIDVLTKVERAFGGIPQDVEAIFSNGSLRILQSRPVTNINQNKKG
jgi:rifampicin phosphotransferase